METRRIDIKKIVSNAGQIPGLPANPRQWKKAELEHLQKSLKDTPELFEARGVIVTPYEGKYIVLGGNMRLAASRANGDKDVPCIIIPEGTPADKLKQIVIKDNGAFGEWDYDMLANEWDDLPLTEWGVPTWEQPQDDIDTKEVEEDDFDEDEQVEERCQRGEIWQLGEHRLMCGDSTSAADVDLLMNGEKADIAITSPPYGVEDGGLREHKEKGKDARHKRETANFYMEYDDTKENWPGLIEGAYTQLCDHSIYQFINVQLLCDNKAELMNWVSRHSDCLCDVMIWDKKHAAPQMCENVLNNRFEFVFIFGGDHSRKLRFGNFHGNESTVIDDVAKEQNQYAKVHRAVFPVGFPAKLIRLNEKASSVLDTFGGTGTTLIACEQLGRKCYMMELDAHYCDVIIARWEKLTGKTAVKL